MGLLYAILALFTLQDVIPMKYKYTSGIWGKRCTNRKTHARENSPDHQGRNHRSREERCEGLRWKHLERFRL